MAGAFDAEYATVREDAATSVLYVDDDVETIAALAEFIESEYADVEFHGTTDPSAAAAALRSDQWGCLVVGGDLAQADSRSVIAAADCPLVSFTTARSDALPEAVVSGAKMVFEKGTDERILSILVDNAIEVADPESAAEDTLARTLAHVSTGDESHVACFVVDGDELVWSSHPFEAAFPATDSGAQTGSFDDRLATVFGTVPDGSEGFLTHSDGDQARPTLSDGRENESAPGYYRHDRYKIPGDSGTRRLELFENVTDRVERETRSWMHDILVEQTCDGLYVFDDDGVLVFSNAAFARMLGYDTDELIGKHAAEIFAEGELRNAQQDIQDVTSSNELGGSWDRTFVSREGEHVPLSVKYTILDGGETVLEGFVCVARVVTERREREAELAARRDELARITRADEMVQNVVRQLGQVATREELERAVADCLLDVEGVTMAGFGQREGGSDPITPDTIFGEPEQYLREVVESTSFEDVTDGPLLEAINTSEVQVVDDFRHDDRVAHCRDVALSYDIGSVAMIPLVHGETVHGILAVYGKRPGTFTEAMAERFDLLSDTIGFAITAVQNKRLIERDVTIRLEFRSESDDACLVRLAQSRGCRLETVDSVDLGDDVLQYLSVEGAAADDVVEAALERESVAGARVVRSEGEAGGVVELRVPDTLQTALTVVGARVETAVSTPSGTRLVVEAPDDGDLRAIHDVVTRYNPGAELVTKTRDERAESNETKEMDVAAVLTERQREILRAAHLAGYYAWPRDTTAEELAESLGIASPTLHQHLRRAEDNILSALIDE